MPSRKKQEDPWWFTPSQFDAIAAAKVYRKLTPELIQKILYTMTSAKYPIRPRRAKDTWLESARLDGQTYQLSCRIDEGNKKIVVTNIRAPREMRRKRHK